LKSNGKDKKKTKSKPKKSAISAAKKAKRTYPKASSGGKKTKLGTSGKRYKF
jgi:hypothetical protein